MIRGALAIGCEGLGAWKKSASTSTTSACPAPNHANAVSYPLVDIILAIGTIVTAAPAPKPAMVNPAAKPRRSGNHLSALPIDVLQIALAPMPLTTAPA